MRYDGEVKEKGSSRRFGPAVVIVLGGALIAGVLFVTSSRAGSGYKPVAASLPSLPTVAGIQTAEVNIPLETDDPRLGNDNAPITVIEFFDFECPFCRDFHTQTFSYIHEHYINTGKVRFVFKDFPLSQIHPQAILAAEAGQCAAAQGKFWEYATSLWSTSTLLSAEDLRTHASQQALNLAAFDQCFTQHEQAAKVARNTHAAVNAGISGTPAFIINGHLIEGALPTETFIAILEEMLRSPSSSTHD